MDTDEIGKAPPLIGSWRVKYLATCFDSTDQTVRGVKNKFDRARLRALIRFEKRFAAQWYREHYFDHGSPDGTLAGVPSENRDAALIEAHHGFAELQASHRDLLKRPALLRGTAWKFLDPFEESQS